MKKKSLTGMAALAMSLILTVSLTGCGNGGAGEESASASEGQSQIQASGSEKESVQQSSSQEEKTVITVWTGARHDLELRQKQIEEFNASNDMGIEIDYVVQTDNLSNMLTMAASSGQSPDIFCTGANDKLQQYKDAGLIQPLNPYITDTERTVLDIENNSYEGVNVLGDEIYFMPTSRRSGSRLIYNKELSEKAGIQPPATLDEVVSAAKALTQAGEGTAYGVIFPGQSSPFERWLEGIAELSGVKPYDYAAGRYEFSGYKPILEAVRQMFQDGSVFPGSTSMKIDPTRTQFAEGNVGMYGNASQEVGVLTEQFPARIEWGVAKLPTIDGTVKGCITSVPENGWVMTLQAKDPEKAWEVIKYLSSEKVLVEYVEAGYGLAISDYIAEKVDNSKIGRMADFAETGGYDSMYPLMPPVSPEGETYRDALWSACQPDGPEIDAIIETLNKTYNDALDKEIKRGKIKRLVIENYDPLNPGKGTAVYLSE